MLQSLMLLSSRLIQCPPFTTTSIRVNMVQVMELRLSCYLVLLSIDRETITVPWTDPYMVTLQKYDLPHVEAQQQINDRQCYHNIMLYIYIYIYILYIYCAWWYIVIPSKSPCMTFWSTLLGVLYISKSGSANAQLPRCFCLWTFSLNIWLRMFPLDSFMSCLHSLLGYSEGEFQALQLIVLAAFGAVD